LLDGGRRHPSTCLRSAFSGNPSDLQVVVSPEELNAELFS
jgi:hypothetical protein